MHRRWCASRTAGSPHQGVHSEHSWRPRKGSATWLERVVVVGGWGVGGGVGGLTDADQDDGDGVAEVEQRVLCGEG